MVVHATVPTKGYCDREGRCSTYTKDHLMYEGHGRVQLDRVLRFDAIDPVGHYVSHVVFPHPVEDMYLFYSSLNSEPLMYLHPKIQTGGKKGM